MADADARSVKPTDPHTSDDSQAPADVEANADTGAGPAHRRTPRDRRATDEVFGDVLPSTTGDERVDPGDDAGRRADADYLRDVPPHHG